MSFELSGLSESTFEAVHAPGTPTPISGQPSIPPASETNLPEMPQSKEIVRNGNPADAVTHHFYSIANERKLDLLVHAIKAENMQGVLVFSHTKQGADMVARRLVQRGIAAVAVHSDRSQDQRERALASFKRGRTRVLVATDIAVRKIEVTGISHLVNFDIPASAEDYTLRIRRSGWATAAGSALTFVTRDDEGRLRKIQKLTEQHYPVKPYPGLPAAKGIDTVSNQRPVPTGHVFSNERPGPTAHASSNGRPRPTGHVFSNERPGPTAHASSNGRPRPTGHASSNGRPRPTGHTVSNERPGPTGHVFSNERPKASGHTYPKPKARPFGKQSKPPRKKKGPVLTSRKRKPVRKLEAFSSFMGDPRYS